MMSPRTNDTPAPPPANPDLLAAGWERRSMVDPERAREMAELYELSGFEVRLAPLAPLDFGPACTLCRESACKDYVMVYTPHHTPALHPLVHRGPRIPPKAHPLPITPQLYHSVQ